MKTHSVRAAFVCTAFQLRSAQTVFLIIWRKLLPFIVLTGYASLLMLTLTMLGVPLQAATYNVNSPADVLSPPPGTVTLRSPIQAANGTSVRSSKTA